MREAMKSEFKQGRWGVQFKNGKLYSFEKRSILVMRVWPDPRAWDKTKRFGWRCCRKKADAFLCAHLFRAGEAERLPEHMLGGLPGPEQEEWRRQERNERITMDHAWSLLPPEVRNDLLRYSTRRWHMLSLHARCPDAIDLSQSNPALFYMLASNWVFHKPAVTQPIRSARALMNRKQKQILEWLGFPANETTRRILAKITPSALQVESLLYLRQFLIDQHPLLQCLQHLEQIHGTVLEFCLKPWFAARVTPRLLHEVSQDPREAFILMRDTLRMIRLLEPRNGPGRFVSLQRLRSYHDELAAQLPDATENGAIDWVPIPEVFPDPPFGGTESIVPIRAYRDLATEGREMHHCVPAYAESIARGEVYVYRVTAPVRATLSVQRTSAGWRPDQCSGVANVRIEEDVARNCFAALLASGPHSDTRKAVRSETDLAEQCEGLGLTAEQQEAAHRCLHAFGEPVGAMDNGQ